MIVALRRHAAILVAVLVAALSAVSARAQTEGDILAVMDRWAATYGTATNGAEMLPLYHPDAAFFGTAFQVPFVGRDSFVPYFQTQFDNYTARSVTFVDPVIRILSDSVATSTGLYRFQLTTAGQRVSVVYRYTFALLRTEEGWQIIQHHSSQRPQ